MEISENLKKYRKKSKLTQEFVAEHLHVTRQTISQWEIGKITPNLDILSELSELYHCDIQQLILTPKIKTTSRLPKSKNIVPERNDESFFLLLLACIQFLVAPLGLVIVPFLLLKNKKNNTFYKLINIICICAILYNCFVIYIFITEFLGFSTISII
ncbi:hypothetical protein RD055328_13520 [Companilactobacillus sp. RD055328]|uniref:helix-turn-helix domain-containing protein n=1 Tax=Companilactobacillus sp. RD055328 TaxID=2916634 RepID=UPI001FC7D7F7|nr:helix-turn-helix transcriptional regulator [Companilactobacillus sp. RD055328]GKQ43429.1 hypothetical protein RD055328_13520 [Companilactobacillus sp. RD055328]